jgi:hypothetical protein
MAGGDDVSHVPEMPSEITLSLDEALDLVNGIDYLGRRFRRTGDAHYAEVATTLYRVVLDKVFPPPRDN